MGERGQRAVLWTVRIALVLALAFSVAFPDLPQFEGKGMAFRAPFYLLPMAAVPIGWRLRGRRQPYPYIADALVIAPFLADTLGNAFNFYNTFDATDDVLHFLNWVLLVAGITLLLLRTYLRPLAAWALAYGIGAAAIIWWEAAEWLVQEARHRRPRPDLRRHDRRPGPVEHRRRSRRRARNRLHVALSRRYRRLSAT